MNKSTLSSNRPVHSTALKELPHNNSFGPTFSLADAQTKPLVLIVSQDANLRVLLERSVQIVDFRTISVATDMEATALMQRAPINLILLDIVVSAALEFRSCEYIRQCGETPVIVLSTMGSQRAKLLAIQSGANAYLTKPMRLADLHRCLRRFL